MKKINKKFGFTLVEMLVVISIIGILTSVLAGGYVNSQKNSRDAARKIQLKSISDALNSFYADNGVYPSDDGIGTTGVNGLIYGQGQLDDGKGNIYIKKMPKEMKDDLQQIKYVVSSTGKSFWLFTNLENPEDRACNSGACGSVYAVDKGCCYAIISSNTQLTGGMLPTP